MSPHDQDDRSLRRALRRMAVLGAVFAATAAFAAAVFALAARSSVPELVPGGQRLRPGAAAPKLAMARKGVAG